VKTVDAIRFCAECLRRDVSGGHPPLTESDWEVVLRFAAEQRVMPAFAPFAEQVGAGASLCEDLQQICDLIRKRNAVAIRELEAVVLVCNDVGVEPVLLKGAARLGFDWSRQIGDLDLLVGRDELERVVSALRRCGYYSVPFDAVDHPSLKHHPRLIHDGRTFPVEVHRALGELAWRNVVRPEAAIECARPHAIGRARARALSATHTIVHEIVHSQLDNRAHWYANLSLRSLFDSGTIAREQGLEFGAVQRMFERCGLGTVSRDYETAIEWVFEDARCAGVPPVISRWLHAIDNTRTHHASAPFAWIRWYAARFRMSAEARRQIASNLLTPEAWARLPHRWSRWMRAHRRLWWRDGLQDQFGSPEAVLTKQPQIGTAAAYQE
jgi:hypothetical protein